MNGVTALSIRKMASGASANRCPSAMPSRRYRSNAITSFILNPVQQPNDDQQHRDGEDDRHVAEPGRVGRCERRHGIEHEKDGESCERDALGQRHGVPKLGIKRRHFLHLNLVQHANDDEQHHHGEDDRHVAEPGRVGGDERGGGVQRGAFTKVLLDALSADDVDTDCNGAITMADLTVL